MGRAKTKKSWYSLTKILKQNCFFNVIFGQRSNGKTYAVLEYIIRQKYKTGRPAVLARRMMIDIERKNIYKYFAPFEGDINRVSEITKGQYNHIEYYGGVFWIGDYDFDTMQWRSRSELCYTTALARYAHAKGADRGEISCLLFDEFIEADYLDNDFAAFLNVVATFGRGRDGFKVFLVGNTISMWCPYFREFCIDVKSMSIGDLCVYEYGNGQNVAVEYADVVDNDNAKYFKGLTNKAAQMITTGAWEIQQYQHYPNSIDFKNDVKYRAYIYYLDEIICLNIVRQSDYFLFVHPCRKPPYERDRVFTFTETPTADIYNAQTLTQGQTPVHEMIRKLLAAGKIFYSDNTTGDLFAAWYKWQLKYSAVIKK